MNCCDHVQSKKQTSRDKKETGVYSCPMHPEVSQEISGVCPKCGMELVKLGKEERLKTRSKTVAHSDHDEHDHDKHAGHSLEMFMRRFWVNLALTILILLFSDFRQTVLGLPPIDFANKQIFALVFGTVVFFYGGGVFLKGAFRELKAKLPGMMTLIGIAISVAYLYSVYAVFFNLGRHDLFWELATLITIMLLGHWLEMKAVVGTQEALKELSRLLPDTAEVIRFKKTEHVPLSEIVVGDLVLVRPGAKIPADGIVEQGSSEVNESMVTGESRLVAKTIGDRVIAGTLNEDGSLQVRVSKVGEETFLAGVMRLVSEAQRSKSRLQVLSDRAAFILTLVALFVGSLAFSLWFLFRADFAFALERLVAVLVIACPHALGLAVPLVASISTSLAARKGFLVKQRLALETARNIDIVVFDKTGTLTKGEYGVAEIITNEKISITNNELLQLAASVDFHSEHSVAKAIVNYANDKGIKLLRAEDFKRIPGKGVRAIITNIQLPVIKASKTEVLVGGEAILSEVFGNEQVMGEQMRERIQTLAREGKTVIYVIADKKLVGAVALGDTIRDESREAVQKLKKMGLKIAMITGDNEEVARWVAEELKIDEYFSRVLPQEKAERIKTLQNKGLRVAMVGDGINDAPALVQADLGIAIGAGTNVAIESAGIILVRNDPRDIEKIITLSRATYRKMIENLFWATGYNLIAMPLAAGLLAPKGIFLQPAVAALFMSLSTVIVAINAVLLKKLQL